MLSVAARRLALATRGNAATRHAIRPLSSIAVDKSGTSTKIEDFSRLDPAEWFPEFTDPTVRSQLSKLREIENELVATVTAKSEPVDWAHWESVIKAPGLVKELKAIHESTPIPDIEAEKAKLEKKIQDLFNPILAEFSKLAKEAEADTAELEKRAAEVTYLRDNIGELSVEEFLEKYPSVKASIEDDIANNKWFINE